MSIFSYSQSYPNIGVDSLGVSTITMTIKQAQKLDNNSDLLMLFKKLNVQIGQYDSICIKVIDDMDSVISIQKITIENLLKSKETKNLEIDNLEKQIDANKKINDVSEKQILLKDSIIKENKKKIRNRTVLCIGEAVFIAFVLIFK